MIPGVIARSGRTDPILSTQRIPRGRDRILSTQRIPRGQDPIFYTNIWLCRIIYQHSTGVQHTVKIFFALRAEEYCMHKTYWKIYTMQQQSNLYTVFFLCASRGRLTYGMIYYTIVQYTLRVVLEISCRKRSDALKKSALRAPIRSDQITIVRKLYYYREKVVAQWKTSIATHAFCLRRY